MDNRARARTLVDELRLDRQPVAMSFVESVPAGVPTTDVATPSACTFWRLAERSLFYAPADRHYECPVGAMTMGFELPPEHQSAAQQLVGTMVELGYFGTEEVPHLPSVGKAHGGVVYGPLEQFPIEPDVVLVIASPRQAMILAEAGEAVTLRETTGLTTMGRPACAAVARTANSADVTLSLGCIGARTYVEVPEDHAVVVLPGGRLGAIAARLGPLNRANEALAAFHLGRKAQFGPPSGATLGASTAEAAEAEPGRFAPS
jgi:uncharacterized protein (DUF169 family)